MMRSAAWAVVCLSAWAGGTAVPPLAPVTQVNTNDYADDVLLRGDVAMTTTMTGDHSLLEFFDVSTATAPVRLGEVEMPFRINAMQFTEAKDFLCISSQEYGFVMVDFRKVDYATQWPVVRGRLRSMTGPYDFYSYLSVRGDHVFVVKGDTAVDAISIADPAAPRLVGSVAVLPDHNPNGGPRLTVRELLIANDKYLLVRTAVGRDAGAHAKVQLVDVTNTTNLVPLADDYSLYLYGGTRERNMVILGDRLAVASGTRLVTYAVPDLGTRLPGLVSAASTVETGNLYSMDGAGEYLFASNEAGVVSSTVLVRVYKYLSETSRSVDLVETFYGGYGSDCARYHKGRVYLCGARATFSPFRDLGISSVDVKVSDIVPTPTPPTIVAPGAPTPAPPADVPLAPAYTYTSAEGVGVLRVVGDRLVVRADGYIEVLSIADPLLPVLVTKLLGDVADSPLAISDDGKWGFTDKVVFDLAAASGSAGTTIPALSQARYFGRQMLANGDYLYCMSQSPDVVVYDVKDPVAPKSVGSYSDFSYFADGMVLAGGVLAISSARQELFLTTSGSSLSYKYSQSANPPILWATPAGVAAVGNYVFRVFRDKLTVTDVSNMARVEVVLGLVHLGRIAAEGRWAYIYDEYGRLLLVDISAPMSPVVVKKFTIGTEVVDMAVRNSVVYTVMKPSPTVGSVGAKDGKVVVYDLREETRYKPQGAVQVAVRGTQSYISRGTNGIDVVDVTVPGSPSLTAQVPATQNRFVGPLLLSPDAKTLVALSPNVGVTLYDVQGVQPVEASHIAIPYAIDAAVHPTVAELFVITFNELRAVSFADPATPQTSGSLLMGPQLGFPHTLAVSAGGQYVYVAAPYPAGMLHVFDVTNRGAMALVGSVEVTRAFPRLAAVGASHVLVAADTLSVVDVSNAASPQVVHTVTDPAADFIDVTVSGTKAFVVDKNQKLHVYDVANPAAPVKTKDYAIPASSTGGYDVFISANCAHVVVEDEYVVIDVA